MNINRDNYEMFFLLYVDNELSAQERQAVEEFLLSNPDLNPELSLLLETTLSLPEIRFPSKGELYKNELLPNMEESMLLHIDNELDHSSARQLEEEIQANADLTREWNILQHTKLDPADRVVFENKNVLFRHEKGRLISINFRRIAAAAALTGIGIFVGISLFKDDGELQSFAVTEVQVHQPVETAAKPGVAGQVKENSGEGQVVANVEPAKQNNAVQPAIKVPATDIRGNVEAKGNNPQKQLAVAGTIKSKTSLEKINNIKSNEMVSSTVNVMKPERNKILVNTAPEGLRVSSPVLASMKPLEDKEITGNPNSYAKAAISDEEAVSESDNHILFINEERLNRTKASGLFRQVKRVLSRNANVKAGSTLKIAGFEIAAR